MFFQPVLLLVLLAAADPVGGQGERPRPSPGDPELLIREGIELRRIGDDQTALSRFQAAFDLASTPRAAAQLGLCELALGHFAAAVTHLTQSLHHRKDAWVDANKSILREALELAKAKVARIEVSGQPAGAWVSVNGKKVGPLPLDEPILVNEGIVEVELRHDGFSPKTKQLNLQGGQFQSLVIRLEELPFPPPASRNNGDGALLGSQGQERLETTPSWVRPTKWTFLGLSAVGFSTGFLAWYSHQSSVTDFSNRGCRLDSLGNPGSVGDSGEFSTDESCASQLDGIERAKQIRTIGLVGGGVFLAASAVLHLFWSDRPRSEQRSLSTLSCGPGWLSFGCQARY